jgi:HNH endonuclease
VPKFKGGTDDPSNIQLICANCHEDKTVQDLTGWPLSPAARLAQSQAQFGKPCSDKRRESIRLALQQKILNDPEYALKVKMMQQIPKRMPIRRCDECGMESLPGALGFHQARKGHSGYTEVHKPVEPNWMPK